jgi:phospholipase/lecithinase/hemolysin
LNDHTSPIPEVIADYTAQVNLLYDLGARHIELALIPSLVPAFADSASRLNPVFTSLVPELQMLHPDAKITLSGWGLAYDDILKNPGKYGITNTTDPCFDLSTGKQTCTTPETYFYYYIVHPSDAAHRIVGDFLFNEALATVPEPASLGLLAAGFGLLILVRRRKGRA